MKVIRVESLSKKYRIGEAQSQYHTLRDSLVSKFRQRKASPENEIWALKDVSFDVEQGEVVGIIGRNGAGKSTLLKILAHITRPTEGRVTLHGRVGSLLEVGTGFHPELTGRENIYLNGAVLGMRRKEIERKFDEIVDFAEIEKFLDTPVKHYSSGMYMRLAFAVAAHLEPEILLVDEVLAVGDAAFQKKCLGKMGEVAKEGRTVLFVSHNMAAVQQLCARSFLLESGLLKVDGQTQDIISRYLRSDLAGQELVVSLENHRNRLRGMRSVLKYVKILDKAHIPTSNFMQNELIVIQLGYDASFIDEGLSGIGFGLHSMSGVRVGGFNTYMAFPAPYKIPRKGVVEFSLYRPGLTPGDYTLSLSVGSHQGVLVDKVENSIKFSVMSKDIYGTGYLLVPEDGVVAMECSVEIHDNS